MAKRWHVLKQRRKRVQKRAVCRRELHLGPSPLRSAVRAHWVNQQIENITRRRYMQFEQFIEEIDPEALARVSQAMLQVGDRMREFTQAAELTMFQVGSLAIFKQPIVSVGTV